MSRVGAFISTACLLTIGCPESHDAPDIGTTRRPFAIEQNVHGNEDVAIPVVLAGTDPDDDPLTFEIMDPPSHGDLVGVPPDVTYVPDANFHGTDTFSFTVSDGAHVSEPATVTIIVAPVNDVPVVQDAMRSTGVDAAIAIDLTAIDVDGDSLTFRVIDTSGEGDLSGEAPMLIYTPPSGRMGRFILTYRASDGELASNLGTVTIVVGSGNAEPVADAQALTLDEDTSAEVTLTGSDAEGAALTFVVASLPSHGSLAGTPPHLTYTPNADYFGPDAFAFRVNDGEHDSSAAIVAITVRPIEDPPVAASGDVVTAEDTPTSLTLVASDPDGDSLSYRIVGSPAHGRLSGTPPALTYTPDSDYSGPDDLSFVANDGTTDSNVAVATITVLPVGDGPVALTDSFTTVGNTMLEVGVPAGARPAVRVVGNVLTNDVDADGDALAVIGTSGVSPGADVAMNADGTFTYLPVTGFLGVDRFQYEVSDGLDNTQGTVEITVTGPRVWYIDNSSPSGGTGRSVSPFSSLSIFEASLSQAGDRVYLHHGVGEYNGPLRPLDGQAVTGEGVAFSTGPLSLPAGDRPRIRGSGVPAVHLADDNTFAGFDLVTATGVAVAGDGAGGTSSFGSDMSIVVEGMGRAVELTDQRGSLTIGATVLGTTTALPIRIEGSSARVFFEGSVSLETSAGGVSLTDGTGLTRFSSLSLTARSDGFLASNAGTVEVVGLSNTIEAVGGSALHLERSTIGPSGVTFRTLSSRNTVSGIVVDAVAAMGPLRVLGAGTARSGGTIADTQQGIVLNDTSNVELGFLSLENANTLDAMGVGAIRIDRVRDIMLRGVSVAGASQHGIVGTDVTHLEIFDSTIDMTGDEGSEHGIFLSNLHGTAADGRPNRFERVVVMRSGGCNLLIANDASSSGNAAEPDVVRVDQSTFADLTSPSGWNGLRLTADADANVRLVVTDSAFHRNRLGGLFAEADGGLLDLFVVRSTFAFFGGTQFRGIDIRAVNGGEATFSVDDNPLVHSGAGPAQVMPSSGIGVVVQGGGVARGRIARNRVRRSSSNSWTGISVFASSAGTGAVRIAENAIDDVSSASGSATGVLLSSNGGARLDVGLHQNVIETGTANDGGPRGIVASSGNGVGSPAYICVDLRENTTSSGDVEYALTQRVDGAFAIQGLTPAVGATEAEVESFVAGTDLDPAAVVDVASAGGAAIVGYVDGTCATP